MRHSNVATTMNVYGNSTLRAKQDANSKVVKIRCSVMWGSVGLRFQSMIASVCVRLDT